MKAASYLARDCDGHVFSFTFMRSRAGTPKSDSFFSNQWLSIMRGVMVSIIALLASAACFCWSRCSSSIFLYLVVSLFLLACVALAGVWLSAPDSVG